MPIAEEPNISLYPFCALALPNIVLTAGLHTFFAGYILLFMVGAKIFKIVQLGK